MSSAGLVGSCLGGGSGAGCDFGGGGGGSSLVSGALAMSSSMVETLGLRVVLGVG